MEIPSHCPLCLKVEQGLRIGRTKSRHIQSSLHPAVLAEIHAQRGSRSGKTPAAVFCFRLRVYTFYEGCSSCSLYF